MTVFTAMVKSIGITGLAIMIAGCGSAPETTTETYEATPPVSLTARLEYQVDSLMSENMRLHQQIEALSTENRNLTAHSAELETRITEAPAAPKPEPAAAPASADGGYETALSAFRQRSFTDAILGFQAVLGNNARADLADNCHYWIGESYYGMRKYKDALGEFKKVLEYQGSDKRDDAQLMLANSYAAMGNKAGAREAYNTLISTYPASPLVEKAKEKLAKLK